MDNTKKLPTVLSLCTGYGGIERGLDLAGVKHRVLTYVEIEAFACANLVAKMETNQLAPAPIWTDLKTFPAQIFRDRIDILTGGYPCPPFSYSGLRKGADDPRHLWPHIRRHIESIRPVRCFFENVDGHISLGLREVIEDLESLGYSATWGVFSAVEAAGAPHQRKRVYILADSNHSGQQSDQGQRQERHNPGRGGEAMADSDSEQPRRDSELDEDTQRQTSSGTKFSWRGADVANSDSRRGEVQAKRNKPSKPVFRGESKNREVGFGTWETEPGLGRVVDGCPDRVDRLRLLGNGVVPQTAAKAWVVLNNQL